MRLQDPSKLKTNANFINHQKYQSTKLKQEIVNNNLVLYW